MTLTKDHLAKKIAGDRTFVREEASEIGDRIPDVIKGSLVAGDDVMISGFGKWSSRSNVVSSEDFRPTLRPRNG